MATADLPKNPVANWEAVRDEWLFRLKALVDQVEAWARELDWSTRRIDKRMDDSKLGTYQAPALLMQKEFTRVLLEPIARFAPGTEGVVDLYWMPAYDDVASLVFDGTGWHLDYVSPDETGGAAAGENRVKPLSRETFRAAIKEMSRHAA